MASANSAVGSEIFAPDLLSGKVALVTGGGTGLGKATALELARCGASVTIAGRREEVLREAAAEIGAGTRAGGGPAGAGGGGAGWVRAEVREPAEAERLVETALERHGTLDLLVNNAG